MPAPLKTWDDVEVNLAANLPGYQARPPQQLLAHAIEHTLENEGILLAQAGCGTGKSLGGMIPLLLDSVNNGRRAVVATATKALQEQYANSDIPFLQEKSGIDFTWALLKGRSNYLCRAKLVGQEADLIEEVPALRQEIRENPGISGDREHFATVVADESWPKLSTSSDECPGKRECPFGDVCFAEAAKEKAQDADLVVTNISMAMADAMMRLKTQDSQDGPYEMLGHYDSIAFDEGHKIREYAAGAIGFEFTARGIGFWIKKAMQFAAFQGVSSIVQDAEDEGVDTEVVEIPVESLSDRAASIMQTLTELLMPQGTDRFGERLQPPRLSLAWFSDNFVPFMDLVDVVSTIVEMVEDVRIVNDVDAQQAKRKMIVKQGRKIGEDIVTMISAEDHVEVRWVEVYKTRKGEDTWKVCTSPVDIAPFMQAAFWGEKTAVVMSATLSSGKDERGENDFTYMKRTLGLTQGKVAAVDVGTPFDFANQALMFVPGKDIPNPKSDRAAWMGYAMSTFLQIVQAAQGGVLSLYTSRTAMEESYAALAPMLRDAGYTVLMQGNREEGHQFSNKQLAKIFAEDTHSILFGLETFFTGVDFQGDTCRAVVLDKLPFPVPSDPIFEARELAEKRAGRRPFNSLSIPMMMLTLEQAQGRLIRTITDTGLFAVLDSRLTSTPYGRAIVDALPDFPVTTEMSAVRAFYAKTRG